MVKMSGAELRARFLEFFKLHGHEVLASGSLVPADDPTLLFTNAGMVQFKDVFLGRDKRPYSRAATSQRCVRAGGKHNDLENVGYTARHHTFFEMLGNFSFGDYFKREAIQYGWQFLTEEIGLPADKLWVTVFEEDSEAERIWLDEVGIDPARLSRIGAKDNFWSMGDTGPCGPCSEIFYDHGEEIFGGPPGSPDEDGDRYIEIWNLVFMQYDRAADGTLNPLPHPSVDTGMGLERLAAILQGVHNNYEIDLFSKLIKTAAKEASITDLSNSSLRVIADHIRSCAFLVVDGVTPSNEGRGYVLRRIIRRALRHGYMLGIKDNFFYKLVAPLCEEMGDAFPELPAAQQLVERVLKKEEKRFSETLEQGMKLLEACVKELSGKVIPGETVFQLYDTFGFPADLTADFAREYDLTIDHDGFETAMEAQRERARAASHFGEDHYHDLVLDAESEFTGYEVTKDDAVIVALAKEGRQVETLCVGEQGIIVLDKTPFYAESGGQAGDRGEIVSDSFFFDVEDTRKQNGHTFLHHGVVKTGRLSVGDRCEAVVNSELRVKTELNHSATHLLHAALRSILGDHVAQKGSLVNEERLRFDFSHFEPVTEEQLEQVERMVNEQIRLNRPVISDLMSKDEALAAGAMALFGEKYGDEVRVLKIGNFSTELCGGTHVERAGDIGYFRISTEGGVASGVRRIEALTGEAAVCDAEENEKLLKTISESLKGNKANLKTKAVQLIDKNRTLEKELDRLRSKLASQAGGDLTAQAIEVSGIKVLAAKIEEGDPKALRDMVDQLKNKLGSAAVVLAMVKEGRVSLVAGVTKDKTGELKAGDLVNSVAAKVGGKGGGRPDMAMAGGNDPAGLDAALKAVPEWVGVQLS
jgi:alanyl-tRNA synthetase